MERNDQSIGDENDAARPNEEAENLPSTSRQISPIRRNVSVLNPFLYGFHSVLWPDNWNQFDLERLSAMLLQRESNVPILPLVEPPLEQPIQFPYSHVVSHTDLAAFWAKLWTPQPQPRIVQTYSDESFNRILSPLRRLLNQPPLGSPESNYTAALIEQALLPQNNIFRKISENARNYQAMATNPSQRPLTRPMRPRFQPGHYSSLLLPGYPSILDILSTARSFFPPLQFYQGEPEQPSVVATMFNINPTLSTPSPSEHLNSSALSTIVSPTNPDESFQSTSSSEHSSLRAPRPRQRPSDPLLEFQDSLRMDETPTPPLEPITPPPGFEIDDLAQPADPDVSPTNTSSPSSERQDLSSLPELETPTPPDVSSIGSSGSSMPELETATPSDDSSPGSSMPELETATAHDVSSEYSPGNSILELETPSPLDVSMAGPGSSGSSVPPLETPTPPVGSPELFETPMSVSEPTTTSDVSMLVFEASGSSRPTEDSDSTSDEVEEILGGSVQMKRKASSDTLMEPSSKMQNSRESPKPGPSGGNGCFEVSFQPFSLYNLVGGTDNSAINSGGEGLPVYEMFKSNPDLLHHVTLTSRTDRPRRVPPEQFIRTLNNPGLEQRSRLFGIQQIGQNFEDSYRRCLSEIRQSHVRQQPSKSIYRPSSASVLNPYTLEHNRSSIEPLGTASSIPQHCHLPSESDENPVVTPRSEMTHTIGSAALHNYNTDNLRVLQQFATSPDTLQYKRSQTSIQPTRSYTTVTVTQRPVRAPATIPFERKQIVMVSGAPGDVLTIEKSSSVLQHDRRVAVRVPREKNPIIVVNGAPGEVLTTQNISLPQHSAVPVEDSPITMISGAPGNVLITQHVSQNCQLPFNYVQTQHPTPYSSCNYGLPPGPIFSTPGMRLSGCTHPEYHHTTTNIHQEFHRSDHLQHHNSSRGVDGGPVSSYAHLNKIRYPVHLTTRSAESSVPSGPHNQLPNLLKILSPGEQLGLQRKPLTFPYVDLQRSVGYRSVPSDSIFVQNPNQTQTGDFHHHPADVSLPSPSTEESENESTESELENISPLDDLRNQIESNYKYQELNREYGICIHLTDDRMRALAERTGLRELQVAIWFIRKIERDGRMKIKFPVPVTLVLCSECVIDGKIAREDLNRY